MSNATSADMQSRRAHSPRKPFTLYAVTFMTFMAASSVPTPLYRWYAGVGFGAGFPGASKTTLAHVCADDRAGSMSAFLIVSYGAFSGPAMIAGPCIGTFGLVHTAIGYGIGTILLSLGAFLAALRSSPSPQLETIR